MEAVKSTSQGEVGTTLLYLLFRTLSTVNLTCCFALRRLNGLHLNPAEDKSVSAIKCCFKNPSFFETNFQLTGADVVTSR